MKLRVLSFTILISCPPNKPNVTDTSEPESTSFFDSSGLASSTTGVIEPLPTTSLSTGVDVLSTGCIDCNKEKIIFVTFNTYAGNQLNTLSGADEVCNKEAFAAGLIDDLELFSYRAWLSGDEEDKKNRGVFIFKSAIERNNLQKDVDYIRPDGMLIAHGAEELVSGVIINPIEVDPFGIKVANSRVWTNTFPNGIGFSSENDCDNWTFYNELSSSHVGRSSSLDAEWTLLKNYSKQNCNVPARLYCIEQ